MRLPSLFRLSGIRNVQGETTPVLDINDLDIQAAKQELVKLRAENETLRALVSSFVAFIFVCLLHFSLIQCIELGLGIVSKIFRLPVACKFPSKLSESKRTLHRVYFPLPSHPSRMFQSMSRIINLRAAHSLRLYFSLNARFSFLPPSFLQTNHAIAQGPGSRSGYLYRHGALLITQKVLICHLRPRLRTRGARIPACGLNRSLRLSFPISSPRLPRSRLELWPLRRPLGHAVLCPRQRKGHAVHDREGRRAQPKGLLRPGAVQRGGRGPKEEPLLRLLHPDGQQRDPPAAQHGTH